MTDGEIRSRPASNGDAAMIRLLVFTVLREHGLEPDPAGTDADLDDIESSYLRPGGSFEVMVDPSGGVVGSVGLFPLGGGRCELRKMYVARGHRGRGLGRRLLDDAIRKARALGFRRVELETAGTLSVAVGLYESVGFRRFEADHMAPRADRAYYLALDDVPDAEPGRTD